MADTLAELQLSGKGMIDDGCQTQEDNNGYGDAQHSEGQALIDGEAKDIGARQSQQPHQRQLTF